MIGEIYKKYFAEFQNEIDDILRDPNEPENFVKTHYSYNFSDTIGEELAFDKIVKTMATYFYFDNGFLGRDIYQLKHVLSEMLFILKHLDSKEISKIDKDFLENRITINYYFLLNCIYNLKEKIKVFISLTINNGKLIFDKSILSETGRKKVDEILSSSYKEIKKYIDARNDVVHDKYDMDYNNEDRKVEIRCFSFDLSIEKDKQKEKQHIFVISKSEIKSLIVSIYNLRKDLYFILKDRDNVDKNKLLEKFTYCENGKRVFRITG